MLPCVSRSCFFSGVKALSDAFEPADFVMLEPTLEFINCPEVPRYMALYPDEARRLILSVRPGITDRAAIEFRDEERLLADSGDPETTYVERIMPVKQRYYLDYVASHSMAGDVCILFDTLRAVLK